MRLKIIAGNVITMLSVGVIAYIVVDSSVSEELAAELDGQVQRDQRFLDYGFKVGARQLLDEAAQRAESTEVAAVYRAINEGSRRERAFGEAEATNRWFRHPSRGRGNASPDIVALIESDGEVIARDGDIHRRPPLARQIPALRQTLQDGRARHDIWLYPDEDKLIEVAVVPVRGENARLLGAMVVGYDLALSVSERASEVGRDVALVRSREGQAPAVYSSSLSPVDERALNQVVGGTRAEVLEAALQGAGGGAWTTSLGGDEFTAIAGRVPSSPSTNVAYVVLGNRTAATAPAGVTFLILLLTLFGVIVILIYGFIIGTGFTRPIEQIEEGVLAVINGRTNHRINIDSPEFGGLAYRINQLINFFTGVQEADDMGRVSSADGDWQGSAWGEARSPAGGGAGRSSGGGATPAKKPATPERSGGGSARDPIDDPDTAAKLASEDEDAYHARLFQEYVGAKRAAGEDVSNIPEDRFVKRLQANAKALASKHGCRTVRFQVIEDGNQVVLRPVIIR